jgi:uncharacterized cupin superfamily protein
VTPGGVVGSTGVTGLTLGGGIGLGRSGAHCVYNDSKEPVHYLMLSTMNAPDVVAYPDSGKIDVINRPPGSAGDEDELAAWFRLADQVDSRD